MVRVGNGQTPSLARLSAKDQASAGPLEKESAVKNASELYALNVSFQAKRVKAGNGHTPRLARLSTEDQASAGPLKNESALKSASELCAGPLNEVRAKLVMSTSLGMLNNVQRFGSVSQALVTGGAHRLPDVTKMPYYDQGNTNGCGTTSLAMIMTYLGVKMTQADIDKAIRRMNVFSSPNDLIEFARDHGLEAEGYNHGSWEEVKSMIDQGYPVEALIQSDTSLGGSANGQHYIAITGYETDPITGQEYVLYHDPNLSSEQRVPVEDFKKMWGNVGFGFDNYFMAFGPKGAHLPAGRNDGIEGVLGALDGVTNITNGLNRLYNPDSFGSFIHGIPQFFGGILQTVGSGIGGAFQLGAGWLNNAVEGIPFLENIVQPFGDIVNGVGAAVGDVFNGIGEAFDDIGGAFEDLFSGDVGGFICGVGEAVGDAVGGVIDAVGDVASAIGDAVSDFFSGW